MNPSILGGLIVDFGEKSIDLSVASRVNKLNNLLQRTFLAQFKYTELLIVLVFRICLRRWQLFRVLFAGTLRNELFSVLSFTESDMQN